MTARYWYVDNEGAMRGMEWRPIVTEEDKKPAEEPADKPDDKEEELDEEEVVETTTTTETKTAT